MKTFAKLVQKIRKVKSITQNLMKNANQTSFVLS